MKIIPHLSVLQFRLDFDMGYGYCKFLDFRSIDPWYGLIVKIYDFRSNTPIEDVEILKHRDYILNPLSVGWLPNVKEDEHWKIVGQLIQSDDSICPTFKIESKPKIGTDTPRFETKLWCPVYNFSERGPCCEYNQVAHLESLYLANSQNIINRATMQFLRSSGQQIEDFYYLEESKFILEDYHRTIQMPSYQKIPVRYRNTMIPTQQLSNFSHLHALTLCLAAPWAV